MIKPPTFVKANLSPIGSQDVFLYFKDHLATFEIRNYSIYNPIILRIVFHDVFLQRLTMYGEVHVAIKSKNQRKTAFYDSILKTVNGLLTFDDIPDNANVMVTAPALWSDIQQGLLREYLVPCLTLDDNIFTLHAGNIAKHFVGIEILQDT